VGHTSLVSHKGSQVNSLGSVVPRELSYTTTVVLGTFTRVESKGSVTGSFEPNEVKS
jgi:hypothetical protein